MSLDDIEANMKRLREARALEDAIERCRRAVTNNAFITAIEAEDAAQSHRSIELAFTPEESAAIFAAAEAALAPRLAALKAALGA